jgi:hypothetical protein
MGYPNARLHEYSAYLQILFLKLEGKRGDGSLASFPALQVHAAQTYFYFRKKGVIGNSRHFPPVLSGGKCYTKGFTADLIKRLINKDFWINKLNNVKNSIFPLVLQIISES